MAIMITHVHDRVKTENVGILDRDDEWRCSSIGIRVSRRELAVIIQNQEADQSQGDNVEESDTSKYLSDGCW